MNSDNNRNPNNFNQNPQNCGVDSRRKKYFYQPKNRQQQQQFGTTTSSSSNNGHASSPSSAIPPPSAPTSKRQRMRSECNNDTDRGVGPSGSGNQQMRGGGWQRNFNKQSNFSQRGRHHHPPRRFNYNNSNYRERKATSDEQRMDVDEAMDQQRALAAQAQIRSAELSDLPGFSYDPITKKYYRILENGPGRPPGSTLRHLRNLAVQSGVASDSVRKPSSSLLENANLPSLLRQLQIGGGGQAAARHFERTIDEQRLRGVSQQPSYSFEVSDTWGQRFASCQFLDVSEDGRTLLGCWSAEHYDRIGSQCSRVLSFNVGTNSKTASRDAQLLDEGSPRLLDTNGRYRCNTYGLSFEALDNGICLDCFGSSNRILVDMVLAPADRDVTCILFATARSFYQEQTRITGNGNGQMAMCYPKIVTKCTVHLRPIEFNLSEEGRESMSSPIYNAEWTSTEPIWSLCFNSYHMKICVGMEKCAKILNVLNGQKFYVSSGGCNVISCTFSKDGNTLFLGRKGADVSMLDLRMPSNHAIGELPGSQSAGYVHLLRTRTHTLITENFDGKIKLWDVRGGVSRGPLAEMESGHRNSSHKLPCFVDAAERFMFAVGEDATVRGWSLHTGKLLCTVTSPVTYRHQTMQSHQQRLQLAALDDPTAGCDFPRVLVLGRSGRQLGPDHGGQRGFARP